MAIIGEWIRRLGYLLRRNAIEEELHREMEEHRALMAAPRAFGNMLRLREQSRDAWGWTWLDDLAQDTRVALRTLRRSPGFSLTAIVTLAFGIGANVGMFAFVNSALLRPLDDRPGDVVGVYGRTTTSGGGFRGVSYPNFLDLREGASGVFENLAVSSPAFVGVDFGDGARRTLAYGVSASYFRIFAAEPLARGSAFTIDEERLGADILVAVGARLHVRCCGRSCERVAASRSAASGLSCRWLLALAACCTTSSTE